MALYTVNNLPATYANAGTQQALTTSFATVGGLTSINAETTTLGLTRAAIFEISVGANSVPNATDCAIVWDLSAITAAGTSSGTAILPPALDSADVAARVEAFANYTTNPTTTASSSRWSLAANQRATYRWVVNPGGPGEIICPATDEAGYLVRAQSTTYVGFAIAELKWRE